MAVAVQHLNDAPPSLLERRNELPKPLCDLVHKLLRKKPEDRYQSFTEVLDDIRTMFKAHKSGTLAEVTIADAEFEEGDTPARRLYGQRPWLTLTLLALLTGTASAGVGWLMRTRIGDATQAPPKFQKLPTAKEEYLRAMFLANDEEAWKSVGRNYRNNAADSLWVHRADEQLLLFYLKDKSREPEARKQIQLLESLSSDDQSFHTEARLAEAYLAAGQGNFSVAKSIISTDRAQFESILRGPWRSMYQKLRGKVYGPPPSGFRPEGPGSNRPGLDGPGHDGPPPDDEPSGGER